MGSGGIITRVRPTPTPIRRSSNLENEGRPVLARYSLESDSANQSAFVSCWRSLPIAQNYFFQSALVPGLPLPTAQLPTAVFSDYSTYVSRVWTKGS